ncbi:hypothetical protein [Geoglobus acetivorans]|uniref:Uncharacterized protein n=1 Tax=Geoglobus acetivorans TaxID=565033 RepID=A0ABZ3H1T8_GEOAI|nr:hypothetical protein [Geoglobus acetivorans]
MFRELVNEIITLLRNNIPDPNTARANAGKNWIYPDFPHEKATMPRISVVYIGHSEPDFYGVNGGTALLYPLRYEISVWVRRGETFTVGNEELGGGALLDYLADQVINVIESNAFSMTNVVVAKCVGGGSIVIEEQNTGILRKPLEFTFYYLKQSGV